jgi:hypothetical protein
MKTIIVKAQDVREGDLLYNQNGADALITAVLFDRQGNVYLHYLGQERKLGRMESVKLVVR